MPNALTKSNVTTDSVGRNHAHPQYRSKGQIHPHIKTFGFDYVPLSDDAAQRTLVSERHDVMFGFGLASEPDGQISEAIYDELIAADNGQPMGYFAYHSMSPQPGSVADTQEAWAIANGYTAEDVYLHFAVDTPIGVSTSESSATVVGITSTNPAIITLDAISPEGKLFPGERITISGVNAGTHQTENQAYKILPVDPTDRTQYKLFTNTATPVPVDGSAWGAVTSDGSVVTVNHETISVPGYPDGWAEKASDSRAMVTWNGGWPAINPTSVAWRRSSELVCLEKVRTRTGGKFLKGLFLDTFDGEISGGFNIYPENLTEMRDHFGGIPLRDDALAKLWDDIVTSYTELEAFLKAQTGHNDFQLIANSSDLDSVYQWRTEYWKRPGYLDEVPYWSFEYCLRSTHDYTRIDRLVSTYDDLEAGKKIYIRSQTNVSRASGPLPFNFLMWLAAAHYCINHNNAWFMIHEGTPLYGGQPPGTIIDDSFIPPNGSHWFQCQSVDIGVVQTRAELDWWGQAGTDRFYNFDPSNPSNHRIIARDYTKALVLSRFGSGGFASIGINATEIQLGGTYYQLLADNTTGPAITSIALGQSEGAVLMRSPI